MQILIVEDEVLLAKSLREKSGNFCADSLILSIINI